MNLDKANQKPCFDKFKNFGQIFSKWSPEHQQQTSVDNQVGKDRTLFPELERAWGADLSVSLFTGPKWFLVIYDFQKLKPRGQKCIQFFLFGNHHFVLNCLFPQRQSYYRQFCGADTYKNWTPIRDINIMHPKCRYRTIDISLNSLNLKSRFQFNRFQLWRQKAETLFLPTPYRLTHV